MEAIEDCPLSAKILLYPPVDGVVYFRLRVMCVPVVEVIPRA